MTINKIHHAGSIPALFTHNHVSKTDQKKDKNRISGLPAVNAGTAAQASQVVNVLDEEIQSAG